MSSGVGRGASKCRLSKGPDMARIRTIKPEFWTSETIAALPIRTRLTFIGLWTYVDDNGVGFGNETLIVAELFPLEDDPPDTLAHVSREIGRAPCREGECPYV